MPHRWKKGESGNPRGRPPRQLSQVLQLVGEQHDGKHAEAVADALWQFATTGKVTLGDNTLDAASVTEWFHAVKWIYEHIDGKQPEHIDNEITIKVEYGDNENRDNHPTPLIPAATDDSEP